MWPRNSFMDVFGLCAVAYSDIASSGIVDSPPWAAPTYGKNKRRKGSFASQRTSPTFRKGRDGRMMKRR